LSEQSTPSLGQKWEILNGDTVAGHLNISGKDGLWHTGDFQPGERFDEIADLFSKSDRNGQSKGWDERQADVHRLKQMGIKVRRSGDSDCYEAFALFVEDGEAKMRVYPAIKPL
jgi:hypothetical protein